MILNKIYKRTKTGAIQVWYGEIDGSKYRTYSGQQDGKITVTEWTKCVGKNTGKVNETTDEVQALTELKAIYTKKLSAGYFEKLNNIDEERFLDPMLADKYEKRKKEITFPCFVNYKYDGMRCEHTHTELLSRNGKQILATPHLFTKNLDKNINFLDGELYNHNFNEDFNKIISLVRKTKPSAEDIKESAKHIKYYIYDVCMEGNFEQRYEFLKKYLAKLNNPNYVLAPCFVCHSFEDIDKFHEKAIAEGYEGSIIRLNKPYENKRSKFLLKRKDFMDEEFQVVDVLEGLGDKSGMAGSIVAKDLKSGAIFNSNIKGPWSYLIEILKDKKKYIGKSCTIKYFQRTPDGIPRFPYVINFDRESYE